MVHTSGGYELRSHNGTHIRQPDTAQLAAAIMALTAPDNTYLSVQPHPDADWYVEIVLPDPDTAVVFDGPYEMHFQDDGPQRHKWVEHGDDPTRMAVRVLNWVQSRL